MPGLNTGKPLNPKLLIMDLRDHWMAKAPYILGQKEASAEGGYIESAAARPPCARVRVWPSARLGPEQANRPLVGTAEQGGVIDPDVLWSCVTCGACVEQCPVDIEHVDHIVDLRRYQVMMESEFPSELSVLFKNLETKANPWGQNASDRTNWIDEVDFDVPVYGQDVDSFDGFEYLFWVGCAGLTTTRPRRPPRRSLSCWPPLASSSWCWAPARRATATPRGVPATSSCSSSWPSRPSRRSTGCSRVWKPSTARSWSPARTASTPSAANTANWAPTTRCYTTLNCSTGWSGTRSWSRSSRSTATAADRRSPTTTRVTWADTTRFTKHRVS
ncbi:4Fe-4S dicluster domain protein [Mycobacterium xenopi 4042]|uniref:4Fe-4S dicluster domain protein n=1 Tax=Mycobacterium xenopi 4042 TaxID=1299334 RepID=X7Z8W6_MYCXE|nr:4Fe-4S dicluster domain protein [Mycobacterium xenopi 4042]